MMHVDILHRTGLEILRLFGGLPVLKICSLLFLQDAVLDDLDRETDGVGARLAAAQKKLSNVLSKMSMRSQMCLMMILIAAVIVLSLFVFNVI